jgi:Ca-activated chloride channel family protein
LLRSIGLAALVTALAGPRTVGGQTRIAARGVAIVMALDRSSSMLAMDFPDAQGRPVTRLRAAQETLARFVARRPDDLIGLVAFAQYPDLACPPTLDHEFLVQTAEALTVASGPGEDGTNIGDATIWALRAVQEAPPRKKVIILLTDGENQAKGTDPPPADPETAAQLAGRLGVTIHTIAVGEARIPVDRVTGLPIPVTAGSPRRNLLPLMAAASGGRAFSASDQAGLESVYATIDGLERSDVTGQVRTRYESWAAVPLAVAAAAIALERLLAATWLRLLPS